MERCPSGQETFRQEDLRRDEKQRRQDSDGSEKGPCPYERPFLAAPIPCIPSLSLQQQGRRSGEQRHAEQDTRQPHPRLFHEHPKLYGLRRRPYPTRGQQRQQDKHGLPYPCLPPPNEQCEQHAANGKRVLPGTPEVRAAQCKSQRGRDKAQDQTHGGHERLLSNGMPHLTRYCIICRDRRHVSRLSPQTGALRMPSLARHAFRTVLFPTPTALTTTMRNRLPLPAAFGTGK